MQNCHITLQDEGGETAELSAEQMALIKIMIALGCIVVRIHRPGYCEVEVGDGNGTNRQAHPAPAGGRTARTLHTALVGSFWHSRRAATPVNPGESASMSLLDMKGKGERNAAQEQARPAMGVILPRGVG